MDSESGKPPPGNGGDVGGVSKNNGEPKASKGSSLPADKPENKLPDADDQGSKLRARPKWSRQTSRKWTSGDLQGGEVVAVLQQEEARLEAGISAFVPPERTPQSLSVRLRAQTATVTSAQEALAASNAEAAEKQKQAEQTLQEAEVNKAKLQTDLDNLQARSVQNRHAAAQPAFQATYMQVLNLLVPAVRGSAEEKKATREAFFYDTDLALLLQWLEAHPMGSTAVQQPPAPGMVGLSAPQQQQQPKEETRARKTKEPAEKHVDIKQMQMHNEEEEEEEEEQQVKKAKLAAEQAAKSMEGVTSSLSNAAPAVLQPQW